MPQLSQRVLQVQATQASQRQMARVVNSIDQQELIAMDIGIMAMKHIPHSNVCIRIDSVPRQAPFV